MDFDKFMGKAKERYAKAASNKYRELSRRSDISDEDRAELRRRSDKMRDEYERIREENRSRNNDFDDEY